MYPIYVLVHNAYIQITNANLQWALLWKCRCRHITDQLPCTGKPGPDHSSEDLHFHATGLYTVLKYFTDVTLLCAVYIILLSNVHFWQNNVLVVQLNVHFSSLMYTYFD